MAKKQSPIKHLLRAAAIVGGQSELARQIDLTPQAVTNMIARGGPVPAEHCPSIERVTGGLVRCEQLNPTVAWQVLRQAGQAARP